MDIKKQVHAMTYLRGLERKRNNRSSSSVTGSMSPRTFTEIRIALGLTQGELGDQLGYSLSSIIGFENGTRKRKIPRSVALAMLALYKRLDRLLDAEQDNIAV